MALTRRSVLLAGLVPATSALHPANATADAAALLKAGGCIALVRHAQTEPGVGDPPGFRLGDCSTQRNLSDAGRAQARRMGQWFASQQLVPAAVRSSAWCRCVDTAQLAFGKNEVWPVLNSFFGTEGRDAQTARLRSALAGLPAQGFQVWITHQVNMTALTGEHMAMGEAFIVDRQGRMLGRTTFA
ncbi:histidine phosphatase family protein [Variovorax sp. VNK109]|uniref:histidine phosphatase family protein n=1 Tax=Variovorax sp. VNK109 TaxID=3400919 RepID=UPI003BFCCF19